MAISLDTIIFTNKGRVTIDEIAVNPDSYEFLSFNVDDNSFFWTKLKSIEKINTVSLIKINFAANNSIKCSDDFNLFNNKSGFTKASSIELLNYCAGISKFELVLNIDQIPEPSVSYKITMQDNNNFFANSLIAIEPI